MARENSPVKINKTNGCKEFRSFFHFVGQVRPVRKKNETTDSWEDQPIYEETTARSGKPMRKIQFNVETAMSNELKVELFGMEQQSVYPYSSKHKNAVKVAWNDRLDKTKFPDETYHLIDPDWDKAEKIGTEVEPGKWVEVKGHYEPNEFTNEDGTVFKNVRRVIDSVTIIENGQELKIGKDKINYVTDFSSPDFKEVNYMNMQVGIVSTYADDNQGFTKVNGTILTYGKDRSEPKDIEFVVYQTEAVDGKKSLADAFASLERLDFIEVTGVDNNRATFAYVPIEENLAEDDPFADVDESNKQTRMERVTNGTKKGLEITGYVAGTLIRGLLTEQEITKSVSTEKTGTLGNVNISDDDPFSSKDVDPFA